MSNCVHGVQLIVDRRPFSESYPLSLLARAMAAWKSVACHTDNVQPVFPMIANVVQKAGRWHHSFVAPEWPRNAFEHDHARPDNSTI